MTFITTIWQMSLEMPHHLPSGKIPGMYPGCDYMRSIHCATYLVDLSTRCRNADLRLLELTSLLRRKHSQSCTYFHAHSADLSDHL